MRNILKILIQSILTVCSVSAQAVDNSQYQSGNMASYVYSASGAKLSVTYTNGATATTNQYCGNMLYEQIRVP